MSDTAVLKTLKRINLDDRSYGYFLRDYSNLDQIQNHIAMTIIIPATPAIARVVNKVKKNNIVSLSGYAVDVTGPGGHYWHSNITADPQTGKGMFIIFWVDEIYIH